MFRSLALSLCLFTACAADEPDVTESTAASTIAFTREHVTGNLYHYSVLVPVGSTANATIRVHRLVRELAPYIPVPSAHAVMLMHGDFATFDTNFVALAPYLAAHGVDVWGFDRRWTIPQDPAADVSDFATMGLATDVDDVQTALGIARAFRGGPLTLAGFSHGGQLAYVAASVDAARPRGQRQVSGLVSLDYYGALDAGDLKDAACANSAAGYEYVAEGFIDSDNSLQIALGNLARTQPDERTPFKFFGPITNREAMLELVTRTYEFAPLAPLYHLLAPTADGTGLAETTEAAANSWLEGSPYHESFLEAVDFDAQLCGDTPPVDAPLSRIRVPLLYIGAAGGVGSLGLLSTTQVASTDVTSFVVARGTDEAAEYGHADLLFAASAKTRVWQPLTAWLLAH